MRTIPIIDNIISITLNIKNKRFYLICFLKKLVKCFFLIDKYFFLYILVLINACKIIY